MKLSQIAAKPQLIKVTIDDADIVQEYGEPLEFWTWDRQPMDRFLRLAAVDSDSQGSVVKEVLDLVMDEDGTKIFSDDIAVPNKVMMRIIPKIVDSLGK